jgi:ABC-type multidrug transport system fused ATPase/permease subunit
VASDRSGNRPWTRLRRAQATERSVRHLVWPYTAGQRRRLALMSLAAISGGFAEAALLLLIARIAFALSSHGADVTFTVGPLGSITMSIPGLVAVAAALVLLKMFFQSAQSRLAARATTSVTRSTRRRLIRLYLGASWPTQAAQREGRLQELLTTYVTAASGAVNSLTQVAISGLNLTALLVTALAVNVVASVGAAIAALLIGMLLRPLRAAVRRRSARAAQAGLTFATGITEVAATLQEVRIFGVEEPVSARIDGLNRDAADRQLRTAYMSAAIGVLYQGVALLLIVGALGLAYAVSFSRLATLGAIVLMMVRSLGYAQAVQASVQSLQESAPYLETLRAEEDHFAAMAAPRTGDPVVRIGDVSFERVSFEYEPGQPVLRDISFTVSPGEIIGIVGPSGSGKSTLVQILLRLRVPTKGMFLVDGGDATRFSLDSWYEHVTFVPQDAHLFAGTVAENIRFFRESVDDLEIERAARLAHIHDDIMSWPLGYETPVGERGSQLSGGQRQRLSIARALAEDPDVVVLDEPTSALDVRSEALMRDTMGDLAPAKTVFVIAHRLSTLSICDRIMVIFGGELQGFDEPAKLEASNPFFREALQLSGMRS